MLPTLKTIVFCTLLATGSTTASRVYGQGGNFATNTVNMGGISATTLSGSTEITLDSSGGLYVCDTYNHRVLYFATGSTTASRVYGQGGNFATNTENKGDISAPSNFPPPPPPSPVPSATSLNFPYSATVDSSGGLYVADSDNNRLLYFATGSTTVSRVYGQDGNFATATENMGGISATTLSGSNDVKLDSSGGLYVCDTYNRRVLYFATGSTTASRVYGQGGGFTTNTRNLGGISSTSLNEPFGVTLDSSGGLYVADQYNSRVLYFATGSTTASRVYGQGNVFTTMTNNKGGISATSLNSPTGVTLDSSEGLYVSDLNRVLYFATGSTTASRVFGQDGNFTSNTQNKGGISATSLYIPFNVALDSSGGLYVPDTLNHRVLYYV